MRVMRIRHMRMHVPLRLVSMDVAVRPARHVLLRILGRVLMVMPVVAVIVAVGVLVLRRVVLVFMAVGLGQVQRDA